MGVRRNSTICTLLLSPMLLGLFSTNVGANRPTDSTGRSGDQQLPHRHTSIVKRQQFATRLTQAYAHEVHGLRDKSDLLKAIRKGDRGAYLETIARIRREHRLLKRRVPWFRDPYEVASERARGRRDAVASVKRMLFGGKGARTSEEGAIPEEPSKPRRTKHGSYHRRRGSRDSSVRSKLRSST